MFGQITEMERRFGLELWVCTVCRRTYAPGPLPPLGPEIPPPVADVLRQFVHRLRTVRCRRCDPTAFSRAQAALLVVLEDLAKDEAHGDRRG